MTKAKRYADGERGITFTQALAIVLADGRPKTKTARNRKRRGKVPHPQVKSSTKAVVT